MKFIKFGNTIIETTGIAIGCRHMADEKEFQFKILCENGDGTICESFITKKECDARFAELEQMLIHTSNNLYICDHVYEEYSPSGKISDPSVPRCIKCHAML